MSTSNRSAAVFRAGLAGLLCATALHAPGLRVLEKCRRPSGDLLGAARVEGVWCRGIGLASPILDDLAP